MMKPHCEVCDKVIERKPTIVTGDSQTLSVSVWDEGGFEAAHLCIPCLKKLVAEMKEGE